MEVTIRRARTGDVPAQTKQLGPRRQRRAHRRECRAAVEHDPGNVGERFDVVDDRGEPEKPSLDGERRLVARLAPISFDRVEDRRLFATDVRARAATDLDVEPRAGAKDAVAEQTGGPRSIDGVLNALGAQRVFAAYI